MVDNQRVVKKSDITSIERSTCCQHPACCEVTTSFAWHVETVHRIHLLFGLLELFPCTSCTLKLVLISKLILKTWFLVCFVLYFRITNCKCWQFLNISAIEGIWHSICILFITRSFSVQEQEQAHCRKFERYQSKANWFSDNILRRLIMIILLMLSLSCTVNGYIWIIDCWLRYSSVFVGGRSRSNRPSVDAGSVRRISCEPSSITGGVNTIEVFTSCCSTNKQHMLAVLVLWQETMPYRIGRQILYTMSVDARRKRKITAVTEVDVRKSVYERFCKWQLCIFPWTFPKELFG